MAVSEVEEAQPIVLGQIVFSGADVVADSAQPWLAQHRLADRGHRLSYQPINEKTQCRLRHRV